MAKKVQTMLVCDLHQEEVEGEETVLFSLEGAAYEIDLCADHAAELHDAFAPFVGASRRADRAPAASRRSAGRTSTPSATGRDVPAIREWARKNGHAVSERGRMSATVLAAYDKSR